jgi:putative IMPACT (imprinted ancient) family translation regulator
MFLSKKQIDKRQRRKAIAAELKKVKKAQAYVQEWSDMPMDCLYPYLCEILNIGNNEAARRFCFSVVIGDANKLAEELYQIRNP